MNNIRLSKSVVGKKELEAVSEVILNIGYLGMGSEVLNFESEIADYLGVSVENVICVNTGTSALQLAVESVIKPGDEVLVPSLTFLSSYQAITAAGGVPVSCEVYNESLTIDIEDAASKITNKTRAVMPVHYASNPANLFRVYDFAKSNNLRVVEDAAHAFGCSVNQKKIGSFGDIICFSFDGIKNITSGEGGAIVAFDPDNLSFIKDARLLSIEKDSEKRYVGQRSWDFDVKHQGYRFHMSNIFAAIGRVQLKRLDTEFGPKRKILFEKYKSLLSGNKQILMTIFSKDCDIIPHIFSIRILNNKRDGLREFLESNNIPTGIHYKPNHLLSFYGGGREKLVLTEQVYNELLTLPLHPDLEIFEIEYICKLINNYLK
jgi:dTDP-4-amino-4,6-dideoxygalactose transaminase